MESFDEILDRITSQDTDSEHAQVGLLLFEIIRQLVEIRDELAAARRQSQE